MKMVMTQSHSNIFVNLLFLCKSLLIDSWCERRVLITVKMSLIQFCKISTNKLKWEVLKIKPENDRKFCIEIDIPRTRLLVYFNYAWSDFYHQTTFQVLPSLSALTYFATQEIFLVRNITGGWTAHYCYNFPINADPNLQYFVVFMFLWIRLSLRLTQKCTFLKWFFCEKNSK
jgi:hypothetical protein